MIGVSATDVALLAGAFPCFTHLEDWPLPYTCLQEMKMNPDLPAEKQLLVAVPEVRSFYARTSDVLLLACDGKEGKHRALPFHASAGVSCGVGGFSDEDFRSDPVSLLPILQENPHLCGGSRDTSHGPCRVWKWFLAHMPLLCRFL